MNIVSILHDRIHYLRIDNPIMGQKKIVHAEVVIPEAEVAHFNIDTWALHLKKALTDAQVTKFSAQKVALILGQRFFQFARIEIPADILDNAVAQYVKTKIREVFPDSPENALSQFFLLENRGKKFAQAYVLIPEVFDRIKTLLSFYELTVAELYPESLLVFDLFAHTLNKTKEEPSLFLEFEAATSFGLLFDATGLCSGETFYFSSKNVKDEIKKINTQEKNKLARLILSGSESTKVRQDNFTKEVGVWTNPLYKILPTSPIVETAKTYEFESVILEYSRELVLLKHYEDKTARTFSIPLSGSKQSSAGPTLTAPTAHGQGKSTSKYLKLFVFVIVSFAATFFVLRLIMSSIGSLPKGSFSLFAKPTPTSIPTPTLEPTPTAAPMVSKEDFIVEVQNGVGTPGLATRFKNYLEKQKYTVESTGNADNYDYKKTVIISNSQGVFTTIAADLKTIGGKNLQFEKTNDAKKTIIIIGTDLQIP